MSTPPQIEGMTVILWTPLDDRHHPTDGCRHFHNGQLAGGASWLAICRYAAEEACYLFRYHPDTNLYSDTFHESVEDAKHQAEFEYEGVGRTWIAAA